MVLRDIAMPGRHHAARVFGSMAAWPKDEPGQCDQTPPYGRNYLESAVPSSVQEPRAAADNSESRFVMSDVTQHLGS